MLHRARLHLRPCQSPPAASLGKRGDSVQQPPLVTAQGSSPEAAVALCCPLLWALLWVLLSLWALQHSDWWVSCLPSRNGGPCAPHIGGWHCTPTLGWPHTLYLQTVVIPEIFLWAGRVVSWGCGSEGYSRTPSPWAVLRPGSVTSDKWLPFPSLSVLKMGPEPAMLDGACVMEPQLPLLFAYPGLLVKF